MPGYDYSKLNADEVAPHLAPIKFLLGLKFNKRRSIVPSKTAMEMYDSMRLKPEHMGEVVDALAGVASLIKDRRERCSATIGGYATRALNKMNRRLTLERTTDSAGGQGRHLTSEQARDLADSPHMG